jgi:hypothetical protein
MRNTQLVSSPPLVEGKTSGPIYRWDAPDGSCSVTLGFHLIDELRRQAIEAYLSLPKRGVEIGGLLFGAVRQGGSAAFHLDACEDLPCEYRFGPSYKLSESDYVLVSERMAQHQCDGSQPIIGLYRSYTGRDAALNQTDLELMRSVLPHPPRISLLLQPLSAEKCMARFQLGGNDETAACRLYEPFLLDAGQLAVEAPAEPEPAHATVGPAEPLEEPPVETPKPTPVLPAPHARRRQSEEEEPARAPRGSQIWLPVLLSVLAAVAGAAAYGSWTLQRQPRWAPMGLDVTASARELMLSWDSTAPAIEHASRGVMSVTDGSAQKQFPLTAAQLRGGKLSYTPASTTVLFRVLVYDADNRAFGDSLRVADLHLTEETSSPTPVAAHPALPPPTMAPDEAPPGATPAVPRREVQPYIPAGIRARVRVRTVVPVQVHIDASGRVTDAAAKGVGDGLDRYLADQSVTAARRWSFMPAQSNGRAIASVRIVDFVFLPEHE